MLQGSLGHSLIHNWTGSYACIQTICFRVAVEMSLKYSRPLSLLFLLLFLLLAQHYLAPTAQQQQEGLWCQNWAVVSLHQHQTPPLVSLHQHQTQPADSSLGHWCLLVLGELHTGHNYQSISSGGGDRGPSSLPWLVGCAAPGQDLV